MDVTEHATETDLNFNFTYAPGITEEQILGVELAGEMWSNYLGDTHQYIDNDDVLHIEKTTINIHVEVGSDLLPDNVIGGAFPAIAEDKYEDIYDALTGDASTLNDEIAVDSLLNTQKTNILVNTEVIENDQIQLTKANLKALDLIDSSSNEGQELDGYILLSDLSNFSSVEWNYDYLGGAKPETLDFLSTITHEIGHTLGFISGADRITSAAEIFANYTASASVNLFEQALSIKNYGGYFVEFDNDDDDDDDDDDDNENSAVETSNNNLVEFDGDYDQQDQQEFFDALEVLQNVDTSVDPQVARDAFKTVKEFLKKDDDWEDFLEDDQFLKDTLKNLNPDRLKSEDLAEKMTSLDLFRYSKASSALGANDLTRGSATYFSLDSSQTDLAMSNGQDFQGSHWQNRELADGLGVMNPTVALNERWEISDNDLMALDAIGWDVNYNQSMDMQALYDEASAAVETAWIGDRTEDVEKIIDGDAYDARRSRRSSYRMSSGAFFATAGYFSTFSPSTETVAESSNSNTGVDFNFTYAPGITEEQILGFELAGEFWSQHLQDDVSINLFVNMADDLPANVIGGALPAIKTNVKYEDYRSNLKQDISSSIDSLINNNQQDETDKFTAYFSSQYEDDGYKVDNNEYMKMTRANAKALNLTSPQDNELDGYILMRDLNGVEDGDLNNIRWNYNYESSFVPSNHLDFLSVAIHEIGHALGFISGLDQANWLAEKLKT